MEGKRSVDRELEEDIELEQELFGEFGGADEDPAADQPSGSEAKEEKKETKERKITREERAAKALEEAQKKGHKFLYKQGCISFNNYRSAPNPRVFYREFMYMETPEVYEMLVGSKPCLYYDDIEHEELLEMPSLEKRIKLATNTIQFTEGLTQLKLKALVFDGTREVRRKFDGAKRWKLSLRIYYLNLGCHNLAQAENLYWKRLKRMEADPKIKPLIFYETVDKKGTPQSKCIYDSSVYSALQHLRMPHSWKTKFDHEGKKVIITGPPLTCLVTRYHPKELPQHDGEDLFTACWVTELTPRPGCGPVQMLSEVIFPTYRMHQPATKKKSKIKTTRSEIVHTLLPKPQNRKGIPGFIRILYDILHHQFPNGGDHTSSIKEIQPKYKYRLNTLQPGRSCPFGRFHDSNGGCFYMYPDKNQVGFACYHSDCKTQGLKYFTHPELEKLIKGINCMPQEELEAYDKIEMKIFTRVEGIYLQKLREKKIEVNQKLEDQDLPFVKDICNLWISDVHAVINHFLIRCDDTKCRVVERKRRLTKYGSYKMIHKALTADDITSLFFDYRLRFPSIEVKGGAKSKKNTFVTIDVDLNKYISGNSKLKMTHADKACCDGVDFFPALGEDDKRTPAEKGNKVNLYSGLDITPQYAREWYECLKTEEKKKIDDEIEFLRGHFRGVLCSGDPKEAEFLEKYYKVIYTKPWLKLDLHHSVLGGQGVGKSLFLAHFFTQIFGEEHCLVIRSIDHLNGDFNADLSQALLIINEEVVNPGSHKLATFIKAFLDTTKMHRFNQKHMPVFYSQAFWKCLFISNEKWVQNIGKEERRHFVTRASKDPHVAKTMQERGWTQESEYFSFLQQCDARGFAYWLAHMVDTSTFDPFRDRFVTQETANQKIHSFHVQNRVHAFWSKFLENQMHNYLSKTNSTWMISDFLSKTVNADTLPPEYLQRLVGTLRDRYLEQSPQPLWVYNPLEEKQEQKHVVVDHVVVDKEERTFYSGAPFTKKQFYEHFFLKFQEAGRQNFYDEASRYDSDSFWKQTYQILPPALFLLVQKEPKRVYNLASLADFKRAFATSVLKKPDFYTVRTEKQQSKKRKLDP